MTALDARLAGISQRMAAARTRSVTGFITDCRGPVLIASLHGVTRGAICKVFTHASKPLLAEVIGFQGAQVLLSPFGTTEGVSAGMKVQPSGGRLQIKAGPGLLGRVVDAFGTPMDGKTLPNTGLSTTPVRTDPPSALDRPLIDTPFETGLRAIDGPLTLGQGQRIGIFGPPGTGKSSLLSSIAQHAQADAIVLGLIGERGREVREFLERDLPETARPKVVAVVATSDRPAVERALCAQSATAVAEALRDAGMSVLLLVDSLTRMARALREIGLAAGEAPTRRGFPASVYPALPALIERAGRNSAGNITAMYTVLMEGDGEGDPIAEEVRSLTDGHLILSRDLAEAGHWPAIDVLGSISRIMPAVASAPHQSGATNLRALMAKYKEIELLLQVGEYKSGGDPVADAAIAAKPRIDGFLQQTREDRTAFAEIPGKLQGAVK